MARITVEDCLDHVDNRFQLVLLASRRARQLARGVEPLIEWKNDKPTVVALREIAEGKVGSEVLDQPLFESWEHDIEVRRGRVPLTDADITDDDTGTREADELRAAARRASQKNDEQER